MVEIFDRPVGWTNGANSLLILSHSLNGKRWHKAQFACHRCAMNGLSQNLIPTCCVRQHTQSVHKLNWWTRKILHLSITSSFALERLSPRSKVRLWNVGTQEQEISAFTIAQTFASRVKINLRLLLLLALTSLKARGWKKRCLCIERTVLRRGL